MTDDPKDQDSEAVKPQVIDLEAEDVTIERDLPPEQPAPVRRRSTGRSVKWLAGAALIAGLMAGGWIYRDLLSAYLPNNEMQVMGNRIAALEINNKTLNEQVAALGQSVQGTAAATAELDATIKANASGIAETQSRIGGLDSKIDAAGKALQSMKSDLDALRTAVSSAGTGSGGVDNAALAAIGQRIDGLEKDVASLKSSSGSTEGAATTAALSQALSDLKAKIAAGTAYTDEYGRIARMVPAAAGLDVLAASASNGLPNGLGLAAELRGAIASLPQPVSEAPASGGYWDSIWSTLSGVITIRDIGATDWPALAEKCASLAEVPDLNQAIGIIDATEGDKPTAITQWRDRAAARLKLEAALDQVSQAVLRQISSLGGAQ